MSKQFIPRTAPVAALCCLLATNGHAGHGLMNGFGDIEWLPDAGITPAHWAWPLERAAEKLQLSLAAPGAEGLVLALGIAREKILPQLGGFKNPSRPHEQSRLSKRALRKISCRPGSGLSI